MGTYTDQDAEFRLDPAVPIGRVRRLLDLLGVRVGQLRGQFRVLQCFDLLRRAVENEDRAFAPADHDLLAGHDLTISRSTGPPAASVEASGFIWAISGTNTATAPTAATVPVAM